LGETCEVGRSSWQGGGSDTGVCVRASVQVIVLRCGVSFHRGGRRARAGLLCDSGCGGGGARGRGGAEGGGGGRARGRTGCLSGDTQWS